MLFEKTVIILGDGKQITLEGNVKIVDSHGVKIEKEISEVVGETLDCDNATPDDSTLVHCYTIQ